MSQFEEKTTTSPLTNFPLIVGQNKRRAKNSQANQH